MSDTLVRVQGVLLQELGGKEPFNPLDGLVGAHKVSSLDRLELLIATEDEFEVEISDKEWEVVATVQDIVDLVDRLS